MLLAKEKILWTEMMFVLMIPMLKKIMLLTVMMN